MELLLTDAAGRRQAFAGAGALAAADGCDIRIRGSRIQARALGLDQRGNRVESEMVRAEHSELLDRLARRGAGIELTPGEMLVLVETEPCQEVRIHAPGGAARSVQGDALRVDGGSVYVLTSEDGVGAAVVAPGGADRIEIRAMSVDGALRRVALRVG